MKIISSIINFLFIIIFSFLFGISLIFVTIIILVWGILTDSSEIKEFFENLKFKLFKY